MTIDQLEISFETTKEISTILNSLGRTEDLAFSPDNSKLAIASYGLNKVVILDIEVQALPLKPKISLSNLRQINSTSLRLPHGITWINNETLIIANRLSNAVIIKIPNLHCDAMSSVCDALQILPPINGELSHSTDCIDISSLGEGLHEIFICSNNGNYVSHYIVNEDNNFSVEAGAILLKRDINTPDGVTLSKDNNWLAISNHGTHKAYVYKNSQSLGHEGLPDAILHGVEYPHGITFSSNQQFLFIADAGAPYLYLFNNKGDAWKGDYYPCAQIRVMDDETFKLGHSNKQEGGPKGLSLTKDSSLIAITCSTKPLAFFYVKDLIEPLSNLTVTILNKSNQTKQDEIIRSLLRITRNMQATFEEFSIFHSHQTELLRNQTELLRNSHSWKMTYPLRKIKIVLSQYMFLIKSKLTLVKG